MDTWSLPKARPISCNDCPAFQRHHISVRWFTESFTRLRCAINTTFREKIYSRWCCIDRLSWHLLSECGPAECLGFSRSFLDPGARKGFAATAARDFLLLGRLSPQNAVP